MLKKFALNNYKNFRDEIKMDFENIAGYQRLQKRSVGMPKLYYRFRAVSTK